MGKISPSSTFADSLHFHLLYTVYVCHSFGLIILGKRSCFGEKFLLIFADLPLRLLMVKHILKLCFYASQFKISSIRLAAIHLNCVAWTWRITIIRPHQAAKCHKRKGRRDYKLHKFRRVQHWSYIEWCDLFVLDQQVVKFNLIKEGNEIISQCEGQKIIRSKTIV